MTPQPFLRLLRTLWYMRPSQWTGKLRRSLLPARGPRRAGGAPPQLAVSAPPVPFPPPPAHIDVHGLDRLGLIGQEVSWGSAIDWDHSDAGPLWAYHLHQFDWVRHAGLTPAERLQVMESWYRNHPKGVGWAPFPISLRSFAWGKLLLDEGALAGDAAARTTLVGSLADQLATLAADPETHLLANHYLWNQLALVFGGVLLDGSESEIWRGAQAALCAELAEQVPADGLHYERCPSYHALLLENLLDLINVARAPEARLRTDTLDYLIATAERMLGALRFLTHPDGEIALFGDSAFGVAQRPEILLAYAEALGLDTKAGSGAVHLCESGFARLEAGPFTLLVTASLPSPSHQPGHAHCDALSFELSFGSERVVTDTGVTEYVPGPLREAARATTSHATVEIEGEEQAELWAAHRIGGRPDVALPSVIPSPEGGGAAEAVCAGWATPEVLHRRRFELDGSGLVIIDSFDRPPREACFSFPLAPGLEPKLEDGAATVAVGSALLRIELPPELEYSVERAPYFPAFGAVVERAVLRGRGRDLRELVFTFRPL